MRIKSWGMVSVEAEVAEPTDRVDLAYAFKNFPALPHGAGRSYGDVALSNKLFLTGKLNRFIEFDERTGLLTAEAGMQLGEIQHLFVDRGWLLPVTPGTQYVTLGGAVANDVHGKNHHAAGTFGEHVKAITLITSDGRVQKLSSGPLFRATIGGLGLTGLIATVTIALKRVPGHWIDSETKPFKNLDEFYRLSESNRSEYSVAWIDCTAKNGRGLFTSGDHSNSNKPAKPIGKLNFPFTPPVSLINAFTLPILNSAYYLLGRLTAGRKTIHFEPFFYPLDAITNWNRAYGPNGFLQHQCVLPENTAKRALKEILTEIRKAKSGSLLAVLKTTAARKTPGMLTFPLKGVTLALDFTNTEKNRALLKRLDEIVLNAGGRINPSKDATQSRPLFAAGYLNLSEFLNYRDPKLTSKFIERLIERQS